MTTNTTTKTTNEQQTANKPQSSAYSFIFFSFQGYQPRNDPSFTSSSSSTTTYDEAADNMTVTSEYLTRDLLLSARRAPDGVDIEIDKCPETAFVCHICSVLFGSSQQLNRHMVFSQRHKKAVDKQRRQQMKQLWEEVSAENPEDPNEVAPEYRDRSAERRAANPGGCALDYQPKDDLTDHIQEDTPIENTNIGHKLLLNMGWKQGSGLGKDNSGIVNPIMPTKHTKNAGLGIKPAPHELMPADAANTYNDYLKRKRMARYAQVAKIVAAPVHPDPFDPK